MGKQFLPVIFLMMLLLVPCFASADGGLFYLDRDIWRTMAEDQQYCAINYKDGVQRMILSVNVNPSEMNSWGEKAVWIFPVPAQPEQVSIDIMKGFPEITGRELEREAKRSVETIYLAMSATQFFIPILAYFGVLNPGASLLGDKGIPGVDVHAQVQKMGLTSELISAKNSGAFYAYLESKSLDLPDDFMRTMDEYIGEDYSFVITWISNLSEIMANRQPSNEYDYHPYAQERIETGSSLGVFISFPTSRIYYPLKPTSVYGERVVPAVIYILGFVQPELYVAIQNATHVDYYYSGKQYLSQNLKEFYAGYQLEKLPAGSIKGADYIARDIGYTKIKITARSNRFTQDLFMINKAPPKVLLQQSFVKRPLVWGIILFITLSCLSSIIAGWIVFRREKPHLAKFFFFGLFNLLTLAGFTIASFVMSVERRFTSKKDQIIQDINLNIGQKASIIISIVIILLVALAFPLSKLLLLEQLFYDIRLALILFSMFFLPLLLFIPLIVWGYARHKKALKFDTLFFLVFMALLMLSWIILNKLL